MNTELDVLEWASNPFRHALPAMIECYESNMAYYRSGNAKPNYPMPAIDYYNSNKPEHLAIGNLMEWTIPVDVQLLHRG